MRILVPKTKEVKNINKIGAKVIKIKKIDFSSRWLSLNLNLKFLSIKLRSIKKGKRVIICLKINFIG